MESSHQRAALCLWKDWQAWTPAEADASTQKGKGMGHPSLLPSQSKESYCRKFAWKVLEARTSGLRCFYTADTTSLEMRFIQLDSEGKWPVLLLHPGPVG